MTQKVRIVVIVGVLVSVIMLGGPACATSTEDPRRIVTFKIDLTTTLGYLTALGVVMASGSTVGHKLQFINALAIELSAANPDGALQLLYAVDKEALVREITRLGSLPATGVLPPGMLGYDPDLLGLSSHEKGYSYQPEKAKRLLAEAGYPDGAGFPVVQLWTGDKADSTKAELAAYQRYLAELGVQVEIHFAPDWPTYKTMLEQGQLPMFRLLWSSDIPDPDNMLSPLLHSISPTNRTFYHNPRVDQLLEQARKELDEAQRIGRYREVERLVIDDVPWIPQHHAVLEYLYQPYVQGVEVSLLGHRTMPMKKIWLKKSPAVGTAEAMTDGEPR